MAPAFEINQKRLPADASPGLRVADDLSNWGIVVGPQVALPARLDDLVVTLYGNDQALDSVASSGHIDDHFTSLATLARRLAQFGQVLEPGQPVITGAYAKTPFAVGTFRGEFSNAIGTVTVDIVS